MKKICLLLVFCVITIGAVSGLFIFSPSQIVKNTPNQLDVTSSQFDTEYPSLPEMIGQLFMVGHWAHESVASTTERIAKAHLGGVIIMSAPVSTTDITTWVDTWNSAADEQLFIAIDQEGGLVSRLKNAPYATTSQRNITSATQAYTIGRARGAHLHSLGINLNFAPVLDTANHPDSFLYNRTFSAKTDHVALATALLSGMATSNVYGVVKHFPGHADTPDDSHETLPQVNITRSELNAFTTDFRILIANNAPLAVMTGHVSYPHIDSQPATLSSFFLTDYLRNELGYTGLIITDDLIMQAIATTTPSDEAAVAAIQAGADICLFAAEPEKVTAAIAAVTHAVIVGTISEERIRTSYNRILAAKERIKNNTTEQQ